MPHTQNFGQARVTHRYRLSTQSARRFLTNADVSAIEVDAGVGNQPPVVRIQLPHQNFFFSEIENFCSQQFVRSGIEEGDFLTDTKLRLHGLNPFRVSQNAINGGA